MFVNSKYSLEFSLPKEEVLQRIEKIIFDTFPNYSGKYFKGKVFENGFTLELMGKDFPSFKGRFTGNKFNKEYVELSIGLKLFNLLILLFSLAVLLFVTLNNEKAEFSIYIACFASISFSIFSNYRSSRNGKQEFFKYLKMIDAHCEIVPKTKSI